MEEDMDQWTQWQRYAKLSKQERPENERPGLILYPETSEEVEKYQCLPQKGKDAVKVSENWPAISKYFNRLFDVIQHNVMAYATMMTGGRAHGVVPYWGGNYINPLHKPIGSDYDNIPPWQKDEHGYYHRPECKMGMDCDCKGKTHLLRKLPKKPEAELSEEPPF
jgi:hypothetical protein